jgi:hypothetical protein
MVKFYSLFYYNFICLVNFSELVNGQILKFYLIILILGANLSAECPVKAVLTNPPNIAAPD